MRLLIAAILTILAGASAEGADFSAFAEHGKLHVTSVVPDSCNHLQVGLQVSRTCNNNHIVSAETLICRAELTFGYTEIYCPDSAPKARVATIDLAALNMAPQTKFLVLERKQKSTVIRIEH